MKHQNRKFLNNIPKKRQKYEEDITYEELERAIDSAKKINAPGEDNIPYEMIKQLGPKAKKLILHICTTQSGEENQSHKHGEPPSSYPC